MRARSLSLFVAALSVAYVAVAAVRASGGALHAWLALVLAPLGLWLLGWRRPVDDLEPPRRLALRACAWGAAIVLAARTAPAGRSGFDAVVAAGTGVASVAGLLALARIPAQPGLLGVRAAARRLDAAGAVAAIASLAAMLALARALVPTRTSLLDPRAIDGMDEPEGVVRAEVGRSDAKGEDCPIRSRQPLRSGHRSRQRAKSSAGLIAAR